MGDKTAISIIHNAIEQANQSKQFKANKLVAEIEENIIDCTVSILVNKEVSMHVRRKNITECYTELLKWLFVANLPLFQNMHIFVDGDQFVIKPKD